MTVLIITHLAAYYLGVLTVCLLLANREKNEKEKENGPKDKT